MIYVCFYGGNYSIVLVERINVVNNRIDILGRDCCPNIKFKNNETAINVYEMIISNIACGNTVIFNLWEDNDFTIVSSKDGEICDSNKIKE